MLHISLVVHGGYDHVMRITQMCGACRHGLVPEAIDPALCIMQSASRPAKLFVVAFLRILVGIMAEQRVVGSRPSLSTDVGEGYPTRRSAEQTPAQIFPASNLTATHNYVQVGADDKESDTGEFGAAQPKEDDTKPDASPFSQTNVPPCVPKNPVCRKPNHTLHHSNVNTC